MYESTDYILKCLKTYQSEGTQPRAKKRRLDHLSWEEKLQRKKLKNRVAAQTSRDRKKAKFEQMEEALKELFKRNESLLQECKQLRTQNQRLTDDNIELRGKLEQSWCANCTRNRTVERDSQSGSAARTGDTLGSGTEQQTGATAGILEACAGLPSLPDLLDELDADGADVDLESLERLAESLLQDIARDMEASAQEADHEERTVNGSTGTSEMVGKTPEQLESGGSEVLTEETKQKKLEEDISQYLLLHHNYAAKPEPQMHTKLQPKRKHMPKAVYKKTKVKPIMPKVAEVIYTPLEQTPSNMIIVIDEPDVEISDVVTEVPYAPTLFNVQTGSHSSCHSPTPSSDCGYESLGSPHSFTDDEIWNNSVSELFPALV